jgi:prepilin-type processing-associated H-X9-DG protein
MNKREELNKLKSQINLSIRGLENYPKNELNVLVSNHNCLMDIFYVPMSLPEEIVSLISARLTYKEESNRKSIIERYLYAMPIEAHGGRVYANMGLSYAQSDEEKNTLLHMPIDASMKLIADSLKLPYVDSYIKLSPKGNVMFADGSVIETGMAQNPEFIDRYNRELEDRVMQLTRKLTRGGGIPHK